MKVDTHTILIILSVLVVLSYIFNYVASRIKIPSVMLLIASGLALQYASSSLGIRIPYTQTMLEILGITGLIFIVLEAALELKLERNKLTLIGRAFLSALILLAATAGLISVIFIYYYDTSFRTALIHAIPLSVISSAVAIPSVVGMSEEKREFIVYESTFSDILGIILFNYVVAGQGLGVGSLVNFSFNLVLIVIVSVVSTLALIFLLNHSKGQVRFFLTFAILVLTYSFAKFLHLPSLLLVLCFGLVINNFRLFNFPVVHRYFSFARLNDALNEMKTMTVETAFIIRTFFFLLFGYSINTGLLLSKEVLITGLVIILITLALRTLFLKFALRITSAPLSLIAPRGLITILLFYSIPAHLRIEKLSEGVLFVVIALTGLAMTIGLLLSRDKPSERIEDVI
ncbi:MAG: hypothetical protein KatS3mg032_0236 [Cyclobacteriaceae bacterium]|nr:MAG: hypothetical protein KatS3mg032_0236 [Cyclobacteriaceae bacterium]